MKDHDFNNEYQIKELAYILKKELSDKGPSIKYGDIPNTFSRTASAKNWITYSNKSP